MSQAEVRAAATSADEATVEEAIVGGDVALSPNELRVRPGTARSALRAPKFRQLWFATFSSNVGTWMQNFALGAFAYHLTHSTNFVLELVDETGTRLIERDPCNLTPGVAALADSLITLRPRGAEDDRSILAAQMRRQD